MDRLPCFDCLNPARLTILRSMESRELDLGELAFQVKKQRNTIHYHLQVLLEAGLVERKEHKKKTFWKGSANPSKDVIRWSLSHSGFLALDYFGRGD